MMTYDFHGPWGTSPVGHNSPLYPPKNNNNPDNAGMSVSESVGIIKKWVSDTNPDNVKKLVMGAPTYGRSIILPQGSNIEECLADGRSLPLKTGDGTWEDGSVSYWDLKLNYDGKNGFVKKYDNDAKQNYLWNEEKAIFISYDTPEDITAKVKFMDEEGLGGMMFWEVDDDPNHHPLNPSQKFDGERLFDAVLAEMKNFSGTADCAVPARSRRLDAIFI
jgi:GH18 family chitinase